MSAVKRAEYTMSAYGAARRSVWAWRAGGARAHAICPKLVRVGAAPTAAKFRLTAKQVHIAPPPQAVALGIAYVPEDRRRHGVMLDMSGCR